MTSPYYDLMGYPDPRVHPETGEPFVACEITRENPQQLVHYVRVSRPTQETEAWDDGETSTVVRMTDEEYLDAVERWQLSDAEWQRRGGMYAIAQKETVFARFETARGDGVDGYFTESSRWVWRNIWSGVRRGP